MPDSPNLAAIALSQFSQRRHFLQGLRKAGRISAEEADARLFPWLAIALRCGADARKLHPDLPRQLAQRQGGACNVSEAEARALLADEHCPWPEALATLAKARDAALRALDGIKYPDATAAQRAVQNAQELSLLARTLGAPPVDLTAVQPETRKEAA